MAEEPVDYRSQKGQDRWVIEEVFLGKRGGFFLDLAASDGVTFSNTYVLETAYDWKGICIEPNPFQFRQLCRTRNCDLVRRCIDGERHEVEFVLHGILGGILADDTDHDPKIREQHIAQARAEGCVMTFETALLADVLEELGAPETIDYFSFDVEGSETRILRAFPFGKYRFLAMTIERPTPELNRILFSNGYVFVRNSLFDSFYVHETLPNLGQLKREPFTQVPPKDWACGDPSVVGI